MRDAGMILEGARDGIRPHPPDANHQKVGDGFAVTDCFLNTLHVSAFAVESTQLANDCCLESGTRVSPDILGEHGKSRINLPVFGRHR